MSIYSNLKELYKDTNDIVNGKNIAWKIIYMLQNISFIIICMNCLVDKCYFLFWLFGDLNSYNKNTICQIKYGI